MNNNSILYISAIRFPMGSGAAMTASQDFYMNHKLVYAAFPTKEAATEARVLFRFDVEGDDGYLYVQSQRQPDWTLLPEAIRKNITGPIAYEIPTAEKMRFRLLAKPSWRLAKKASPMKGKRITFEAESDQRKWLERKAAENGFRVEECVLTERVWFDTKTDERLRNGDPKPLYAIQFDGILTVTDRQKLEEAVRNGIGPQKAYGFGLLSLAPL